MHLFQLVPTIQMWCSSSLWLLLLCSLLLAVPPPLSSAATTAAAAADPQPLAPFDYINGQLIDLDTGVKLYRLAGLKPSTGYEVRLSFPATVSAAPSLHPVVVLPSPQPAANTLVGYSNWVLQVHMHSPYTQPTTPFSCCVVCCRTRPSPVTDTCDHQVCARWATSSSSRRGGRQGPTAAARQAAAGL